MGLPIFFAWGCSTPNACTSVPSALDSGARVGSPVWREVSLVLGE